jgi:hypothetical protein
MLEDAVQGKGAFSRFRRAIDRANLAEEWYCFADDRRWGRARQQLADLGLRPAQGSRTRCPLRISNCYSASVAEPVARIHDRHG